MQYKHPTQEIVDTLGNFSLHSEGEWSGGNDLYEAFNDAGVECEVGEFLYSMVRIMKPYRVLETGTHHGVGAMYMGLALKHNKTGVLDTYEFQTNNFETAGQNINKLGLHAIVRLHLMDVAKENFMNDKFQLILLDTEPQTRYAEMARLYDHLDVGGFVFIHDLHRHMHQIPNEEHGFAWPFGELPKFIKEKVRDGSIRPFHFPTPRGLTGFYKVCPRDYIWT